MLAFHIIIRGYHGGLWHAANAILYNGLTTDTENSPVAQQLRQKNVSAPKAANVGNRTTGPKKAPTREEVRSNDQSLEELLRTHGPQNGEIGGEKFWIKEHQDVLAHPADGTPSTNPDWTFPSGKLVFDELCLEGLRERFKKRPRQNTCHNTVQATRSPTFGLRKRMVRNSRFEQFPVSCEGYTLVYIVLKDARPVGSIVPLEQHTTKRIIIPNQKWSNDCVVCSTKARQEHPYVTRKEMCRNKLPTKSIFGCPQCNKGKGVSVCKDCWNDFDHQTYMM
ncbi:hypothetical protein IV203_019706 [Nitzschia inconspicua]|uniref:Uncharacterized protein n=1 Tax=Nitzschia inconspicua TaxID=303405 RepID=A0A9K3M1F6_9STRA|nr:hypothetical protein IV203_019706 [Nitzschia inconspicua]